MKKIYWAASASKEAPQEIKDLMLKIAKSLGPRFSYRSAAIQGIDQIIAENVLDKEIFRPNADYEKSWGQKILKNEYRGHFCLLFDLVGDVAREKVSKVILNWDKLNKQQKLGYGRIAHVLFGADLKSPVKFVLAYSEDSGLSGITGVMMRTANDAGIPVIDLGSINFRNIAASAPFDWVTNRIKQIIDNKDKEPVLKW